LGRARGTACLRLTRGVFGALISHAVIVSRELAIRCAVSVTDATLRIPKGALIEVDGNSGAITIIEMP
jgi:rifampicin phosphotransferase